MYILKHSAAEQHFFLPGKLLHQRNNRAVITTLKKLKS